MLTPDDPYWSWWVVLVVKNWFYRAALIYKGSELFKAVARRPMQLTLDEERATECVRGMPFAVREDVEITLRNEGLIETKRGLTRLTAAGHAWLAAHPPC